MTNLKLKFLQKLKQGKISEAKRIRKMIEMSEKV